METLLCALGDKLPVLAVQCLQPRVCKQSVLDADNSQSDGKEKIPSGPYLELGGNWPQWNTQAQYPEVGGEEVAKSLLMLCCRWGCWPPTPSHVFWEGGREAVMLEDARGTCLVLSQCKLAAGRCPVGAWAASPILPKAQWPPRLRTCFSRPELWMLLGAYGHCLMLISLFFPPVARSVGKSCDQRLAPRQDSHG